jgi:hypothetical protein
MIRSSESLPGIPSQSYSSAGLSGRSVAVSGTAVMCRGEAVVHNSLVPGPWASRDST